MAATAIVAAPSKPAAGVKTAVHRSACGAALFTGAPTLPTAAPEPPFASVSVKTAFAKPSTSSLKSKVRVAVASAMLRTSPPAPALLVNASRAGGGVCCAPAGPDGTSRAAPAIRQEAAMPTPWTAGRGGPPDIFCTDTICTDTLAPPPEPSSGAEPLLRSHFAPRPATPNARTDNLRFMRREADTMEQY